jgi:serine/threonine protein kinase
MLTNDQVLGKGRYRIISNYTHDECGGIYEAYDTVSNTNVVLRESVGSGKVMTAVQLDAMNNAFAGEAKALTEVRHESLLSVQDYFCEIDHQYLVMESVDGSDFTRFLKPDENPPALKDVLSWTESLLDALVYLHTLRKPIIHRDIRPASVRLTSNFKVKLLTAGISAESADVIMAAAENPSDSAVLNYRPLEQLWGGLDPASQKVIANSYEDAARRDLYAPLDARSDIYSLGATIYHVLSRTLPCDALERSIEILDDKPDLLLPLCEVVPSVPEEVSKIVMKAMELKRVDRYDSAASMRSAVADALDNLKEQKSTSQPRLAPEPLAKAKEPSPSEQEKAKAEAETKRLGEEQKAAEAKRVAREAEEQKRADERRREMEADLERQRREAERLKEAEQAKAKEAAKAKESAKAKEAKPEAQAPAPAADGSTDDQFLLEVPVPVAAAETPSDSFEWSEDISEQPAARAKKASSYTEGADVDFGYGEAPKSNFKFIAAGAGALVVVLAVVGWMFMGGSEKPQSAQSQQSQQVASPNQDQAPVSAYTQPGSDASVSSTDQPPTVNETVTVEAGPNSVAPGKKKPTPTPSKSPDKKKVTVDDLINDN